MSTPAVASTALVLLGHGSHVTPETGGLVWRSVDALRSLGVADEVTAAFWTEMPSFRGAVESLQASDMTLVPLFTARGFFTQAVIPAEVELTGRITSRAGRVLRYAPPLTEHPRLSEIVSSRIRRHLTAYRLDLSRVSVLLIGHGTPLSPESREATLRQQESLQEQLSEAEVRAVFLDDSPGLQEAYRITSRPYLLVVPFFLALGSHVTLDIPRALGVREQGTPAQVCGRIVFITEPVGTGEDLAEIILDLARLVDAPLRAPAPGSPWECFPRSGLDELIQEVESQGLLRFGELLLTPSEVRPVHRPGSQTFEDPAGLRRFLREHPFRPLATSRDLPGGWRMPVLKPQRLHAIVETVYPGAVADWARGRRGESVPGSLQSTASRQVGRFRQLGELSLDACALAVQRICSRCIRHPTWFDAAAPPDSIPCFEPCNWWMSRVLEEGDTEGPAEP